jgi:hypothetical protein
MGALERQERRSVRSISLMDTILRYGHHLDELTADRIISIKEVLLCGILDTLYPGLFINFRKKGVSH